jgi:hypothetical protein
LRKPSPNYAARVDIEELEILLMGVSTGIEAERNPQIFQTVSGLAMVFIATVAVFEVADRWNSWIIYGPKPTSATMSLPGVS